MKCKKCNYDFEQTDACLESAGTHTKILCPVCNSFYSFVQQSVLENDYVLPFGKYKGMRLSEVPEKYILFLANGRGKVARFCQEFIKKS